MLERDGRGATPRLSSLSRSVQGPQSRCSRRSSQIAASTSDEIWWADDLGR